MILLGRDWNAHSDRWDPQCPPSGDGVLIMNFMDEYNFIEVTDGEVTHVYNRNGDVSTTLIDFLIPKAEIPGGLEISTDLTTTLDHPLVHAHSRWDEGEVVKVSRKITGWDIDGLKGEKENYEKPNK
jgi:hypothetical protein